jgi:hypothetical protein
MKGFTRPSTQVKTGENLAPVPESWETQFRQQIERIIGVEPGHWNKIKLTC